MPQTREGAMIYKPIVKAKTASYTVTAAEDGVMFTNRGATASVTFSLPAITAVPAGTEYRFFGISAYGFVVTATGANCVAKNNAAFTSLTCTTTSLMIGAAARYVSDGTSWLVYEESVGPTYALS